MTLEAKMFDQFTGAITAMVTHADGMAKAKRNLGRPCWLKLADDVSTRKKMLEKLDRKDMNETMKQIGEKPGEVTLTSPMTLSIQHDFVAAIARDFFHLRRPRLHRLAVKATVAGGYGGSDGVLRGTIQKYVQDMKDNNR